MISNQGEAGIHGGYHVRLEPSGKRFDLKLGELWRYRDLVLLLTKKSFTVTYQQTILGPMWIMIQPILSSLIYMFIFGHIADIGTAGIPQILFYFVSSAVWELFSFSMMANANTFISNANLFSKVYFPRLAVPISTMLVSILKFAVQLLFILALMGVYVARGDIHPQWAWFPVLPLLFLQMSLLGMSVGVLVSSLTTKYRDLLMAVNLGVSLWMYATPVVYPMRAIPEGFLKTLIRINPASEVMELIRLIMLGEGDVDLGYYALSAGVTVLLFIFSAAVFNRVERTFQDTV